MQKHKKSPPQIDLPSTLREIQQRALDVLFQLNSREQGQEWHSVSYTLSVALKVLLLIQLFTYSLSHIHNTGQVVHLGDVYVITFNWGDSILLTVKEEAGGEDVMVRLLEGPLNSDYGMGYSPIKGESFSSHVFRLPPDEDIVGMTDGIYDTLFHGTNFIQKQGGKKRRGKKEEGENEKENKDENESEGDEHDPPAAQSARGILSKERFELIKAIFNQDATTFVGLLRTESRAAVESGILQVKDLDDISLFVIPSDMPHPLTITWPLAKPSRCITS